ncbi:acetyltransferase [Streptomyces longisporoflavus]|uniref:GNAT family N-acetyltransferase n=1 Tax=Streptomyces longisporoflavus TaxID=28044 RepID=UPI00167D0F79|nr:GNAT family protein [Streptomyces longisporoflavus]GGV24865.1 acetyltransferase [Streptomyces longisporoflavus]
MTDRLQAKREQAHLWAPREPRRVRLDERPSRPPEQRAVLVEGATLRLREFVPGDVEGVLDIFGDPRTTREFGMPPFRRPDAEALVEQARTGARRTPRTHYRLGVSEIATGELIGSAKLIVEDQSGEGGMVRVGYRSAEVGLALRADRVSVGHSVEIGFLLGVLGFDRLGLHRVWSGFMPSNIAAQRAIEKAGMVREGRLRHYGHVDGVWHDIVQYSILEDDWKALRAR